MTITQLWIYRHNSGVAISKHLNCVNMLIIYTNPNLDWLAQLLPYDHTLIVSISKRFTSSHQIRVGLSLVFYSYGNHGIKIDG